MLKEIFRAYDIRGIVDESLTDEIVVNIGKALGTKALSISDTLLVGRDGRLSGERFSEKLISGILSTGCNVVDIGMVPTPVLYFSTKFFNINSAIMITGSHNPANYNGFKIILNDNSLYGESILEIYDNIKKENFLKGKGLLSKKDIKQSYIDFCNNKIKLNKKLKVVIDCGNGVTGCIAQELFEKLGCEVVPLYTEVDGRFLNHHPDPGKPENLKELQETVVNEKADVGIAFDGDGDRLGVVDNKGEIIFADRILILFAKQFKKPKVIYDVKCTKNVSEIVKKYGGTPIMWKTGHSLIKAKMKETEAEIAGEMSGHIFFKENYGFDDALYAGLKLLENFINSDFNDFSKYCAQIPDTCCTPEIVIKSTEQEKFKIIEDLISNAKFKDVTNISTIDGIRVEFKNGWGLVRASNTSPNLVARFEADDEKSLQQIKEQFFNYLKF